MTEELVDDKRILEMMTVESVTSGLLALVTEKSPNRTILGCGAGGYARAVITETDGIYLPPDQQTPENVLANWSDIDDQTNAEEIQQGWMQTNKYVAKAAKHHGVDLSKK